MSFDEITEITDILEKAAQANANLLPVHYVNMNIKILLTLLKNLKPRNRLGYGVNSEC